ncbi:adenosylcobinamide-GDP ribazoletransferase [Haloarchaeobius sp. HRN-SO-5]|uniref:adenosylcobinamide-GDP ribazoletransferase n=1 Tax=Haloarchaeobius sp. HRN-SO-5 TaxID=3446118 RepID=UPI003EBBD924
MVLSALAGAVGFLTRLPVGHDERAWTAYRDAPVAAVPVGYLVGGLVALPFLVGAALPVPAPAVAFAYLVGLYAVTGIAHLDGVADCGDAAVVHGDADRRREVLKDTTTGVGALSAVSLVVAGLALGALALAGLPLGPAVAVVVASEVGAKAGLAVLAGVADPPHDGLGRSLADGADAGTALLAAVLAFPAAVIGWPTPAGAASLVASLLVAAVAVVWARRRLGGVTGDVFGATNELARVVAVHAGVIAWTAW